MASRKTPAVKALDDLQKVLDSNRIEWLLINSYEGADWITYRAGLERSNLRLESAIRNVAANGVPEGYGDEPEAKPKRRTR